MISTRTLGCFSHRVKRAFGCRKCGCGRVGRRAYLSVYEESRRSNVVRDRGYGIVIGRGCEGKTGAGSERAGSVRGATWCAAAAAGETAARHGHDQRFSGNDFVGAGAPVLPAGHLADPLVLVHRIGAVVPAGARVRPEDGDG